MDPFLTLTEIKELLATHDLKPNKKLGQNFLIDRNIFDKIIKAASLSRKDNVIEIGAGLGSLTRYLCQNAGHVLALEIDRGFIPILQKTLASYENKSVIHTDILKQSLTTLISQLPTPDYKLIANIPYQITSPLINKFLLTKTPPKQMILLVQKDVAERILATPPDMNRLAILVRYFADVKKITDVSLNSFWPRPKVTSSLISIQPKTEAYEIPMEEHEHFLELVKIGFSQKRKKLIGLLAQNNTDKNGLISLFEKNKISSCARAQELNLADWHLLYAAQKTKKPIS